MQFGSRLLETILRKTAGFIVGAALLQGPADSFAQQSPTQEGAPAQLSLPQTPGTALPPITVEAPKQKPRAQPSKALASVSAAQAAAAQAFGAPNAAQAALDQKMKTMDEARENLLPKIGATASTITREAIETSPQGDNAPIDKVILQFPGVSSRFGGVQSRISRPQRIRQRPISHQRRRASGRGFWSWARHRYQLPAAYRCLREHCLLNTVCALPASSISRAGPLPLRNTLSVYGGSHGTLTPSLSYGKHRRYSIFLHRSRQLE